MSHTFGINLIISILVRCNGKYLLAKIDDRVQQIEMYVLLQSWILNYGTFIEGAGLLSKFTNIIVDA